MLTIDDRIAIQDLLASYCFTLDDRDWTAFSALFHPDAEIDFSAFGGPTGSVETLTQFLKPIAEQVPSCLLYTSPSPRDKRQSRMPSSA